MGKEKFIPGRRAFLGKTGLGISVLGAAIRSDKPGNAAEIEKKPRYVALFEKSLQFRKIDSHNHVYLNGGTPEKVVESMNRMGIERVAVSIPEGVTPEEFRNSNDKVLKAMKQFPDRIMGQCYINPAFLKEALKEIDRCLDSGMIQLGELYTLYKINDPVYFPIVEKCIEKKIPLMTHARCDLGLWRPGYSHVCEAPPATSIADDFADLSKRYPEAMIIHAHIGGGGDWEYMCKRLRSAPGVYVDTSGSVTDEGMIDFALKSLGEDRLLFASDMNYETAVGKIMAANLTDNQRKKIFFDNYNSLLKKAGRHVN